MIRYDLKCANGHRFDSWFSSAADFDKLLAAGLLSCVSCGSTEVAKAVMAPRVNAGEKPSLVPEPDSPQAIIQKIRAHVESTADNVGTAFATEARRMHAGETPERPIYGEARPEEAKALIEDGVPVLPLPWRGRKSN